MITSNVKRAIGLGVAILTLSAGSAFAAVTTDTSVNVMGGPGAKYHTVARLAADTSVSITRTDKAWCKISAPGTTGWVPCSDLNSAVAKPVASASNSGGWHGYDYNTDPYLGPNAFGGPHVNYNGEYQ